MLLTYSHLHSLLALGSSYENISKLQRPEHLHQGRKTHQPLFLLISLRWWNIVISRSCTVLLSVEMWVFMSGELGAYACRPRLLEAQSA